MNTPNFGIKCYVRIIKNAKNSESRLVKYMLRIVMNVIRLLGVNFKIP